MIDCCELLRHSQQSSHSSPWRWDRARAQTLHPPLSRRRAELQDRWRFIPKLKLGIRHEHQQVRVRVRWTSCFRWAWWPCWSLRVVEHLPTTTSSDWTCLSYMHNIDRMQDKKYQQSVYVQTLRLPRNVVNQQCTSRSPVVRSRDGSEGFLSCLTKR